MNYKNAFIKSVQRIYLHSNDYTNDEGTVEDLDIGNENKKKEKRVIVSDLSFKYYKESK